MKTSRSKATTRIRTSRPRWLYESRCERLMSLTIRRARPDEAGLVLSFVRELAEYEKLLHEVEATEAIIGAALFGSNPRLFCEIAEWNGRAGRLRGLVRQFFHLQRPLRNLSGRSVRPSGAARQRHRQGAAGASRAAVRGQRLVATAMVGAGLEHAVDRILQIARRGPDGRVDGVPGRRSGADGAGARDALEGRE